MLIGINNNNGRYIAQYEAFVTQYNKVDDLMVTGKIKTNDDRRLLLSESVINVIEYYAPILQVNDKLHTHILI